MNDRSGFGERLREFGLGALGITLLVSLLAIWVSWTETMFLIVMATLAGAGVLYCVLYAFHDARNGDRLKHGDSGRTRILTGKFVT